MEKIGKYELLEKIGTGGFGVVYKGRDPFIKRFVAVKTCSSESEEMRRRFFREAEIAGNLHHRNVTTVYDFGFQGDVPYLVQEFLSGEDLDQIIKRRSPLPDHLKVGYLAQIAAGLEYAHSQGVVHRDIKPSNIRVLDGNRIKIMDFGIAKLTHVESQLTQTGMTLGTSSYLAPEQIKGEDVTASVDIFSFGVLGYELLTLRRPFEGETISSLFYKILSHEPQPIRELWSACEEDLAAVVHRCLEKEPAKRFESMGAILAALAPIEERLKIRASDSDRQPTQTLRVPTEEASRTMILPEPPSEGEIERLGHRVDELLQAGNPTAAEVEVTIARKRHGTGAGFDTAVAPILDRIARNRKTREDERRRGEKLQALLDRSRELEDQGSHEEALLVLRTARDLEPESEEVAARLEVVEARVAEERRAREREERAQEVSRLLGEGELEAARSTLGQLEPDPDARDLVAPLRDRLERLERREEAAKLLDEAREAKAEGRLEDALALAKRARKIDDGTPGAAELVVVLKGTIDDEREAKRREVKRQEAERQVRAALAAGEVQAARSLLGAAERELPGESIWADLHRDLEALEAQRTEDRRKALDRLEKTIDKRIGTGEFDAARREVERSRMELGSDERLAAIATRIDEAEMERRRQEVDDLLAGAATALDDEDLDRAASLLDKADACGLEDSRRAELRERLDATRTEIEHREREEERAAATDAAAGKIEKRLAAGKLDEAGALLAAAVRDFGSDERWDALRTDLEARETAQREREHAEAVASAVETIEGHLAADRTAQARTALEAAVRELGPDERWEAFRTDLAARERAREEQKLSEALATGRKALEKGDLSAARRAFGQAQETSLASSDLADFRKALEKAEAEKARREEAERRAAAVAAARESVRSALDAGDLRGAGKALQEARAELPGEAAWDELGQELEERERTAAEERRARRAALLAHPALRYGAIAAGLAVLLVLAIMFWPDRPPQSTEELVEETGVEAESGLPDAAGDETDLGPISGDTEEPDAPSELEQPDDSSADETLAEVAESEASATDPGPDVGPTPPTGPSPEALSLVRQGELALRAGRPADALVHALNALDRAPDLASARELRDRVVRDASERADAASRDAERLDADRLAPTELRRAVDRRNEGRAAARNGRHRDALAAFTTSTDLFRRAGQAAKQEAGRRAAAAAAEEEAEIAAATPPPADPPPADPTPDPREDVLALVRAYEAAMESRSFAAVQRVFPSVPPAMRGPLESYRSLQMDLSRCAVDVTGDRGTVRCAMRQVVVPSAGGAQPPVEGDILLTVGRSGERWVITDRTLSLR